jgi:WD40 repeat protein
MDVSWDKTARVWDAAIGQPVTGPLAHQAPVVSAAFSPDGTRVITASGNGTARVWDVRLEEGTLAQWEAIAQRSPFVLRGIALLPREPMPAGASATFPTRSPTLPPRPPSPDERRASPRLQLP